MINSKVRSICFNAIIAALYAVITISTSSFSFGPIQIRLAEALMLLVFFKRDYVFGLTIGCFIANLVSPYGIWDITFGTSATLIACLIMCIMRKPLFISTFIPVISNAIIVGLEIYYLDEVPFWIGASQVALGEIIAVSVIGYAIFMIFGKRPYLQKLLGFNRNLDFVW